MKKKKKEKKGAEFIHAYRRTGIPKLIGAFLYLYERS
jgi:hypothetical protein